MGTITTGVGLISGINSANLIDQLLAIEAKPKTILQNQITVLNSQSAAFSEITARLLAFRGAVTTLTGPATYKTTTATSSNKDVVSATSSSSATPGSYTFHVQRLVTTQQAVSKGFADSNYSPLSPGTLTFESGAARLEKDFVLSNLRGGQGISRGKIRITDRDNNSTVVDLSRAVTVNDVLEAINGASGISVSAEISGDGFKLTDTTGGAGTFKVENVGTTATATSLGLTSDSDVDPTTITAASINYLSTNSLLGSLNDGNGVNIVGGTDLTFSAGASSFSVDLTGAKNLNDVITKINSATGNTFITASLDPTKTKLKLANTAVDPLTVAGYSAADLGIDAAAVVGDVTGRRLIAGLNSKLLQNLHGGTGTSLGSFDITARDGTAINGVNLASAVSASDVISAINNAAGNNGKIVASLNDAGNGFLLTDTTAGTGNLIITGTGAADIGFADGTSVAADTLNSSDLQLRYISEGTRLDTLNGGSGIVRGQFTITDSRGISATVDLTQGDEQTIGDVLREINSRGLSINARVNDNGDGILLEDTGPGTVALKVTEKGSTTASTLGLLGQATAAGLDLDGSLAKTVTIPSYTSLTGATTLASLNGGKGVANGVGTSEFSITRRDGTTFNVDLDGATTITDLINTIATASGGNVTAAINSNATGLVLTDTSTSNGSSTLRVTALNSSTAAADLGFGSSATISDNTLRGTDLVDATTLEELAQKINDASVGVRATIINDGSGISPYRLSFTAAKGGSAGAFVFDDNGLGLGVTTLSQAKDAVVLYGSSDPASAVAVVSPSNTLSTLVSGLTIDLNNTSSSPVTVNVSRDDTAITKAIQSLVDGFNAAIDTLNKYDKYDTDTKQRGLLLGDYTIATIRSSLYSVLNSRNSDLTTQYTAFSQIGIKVGANSKLTFDSAKFTAALANDRAAVEKFFTFKTTSTDSQGTVTTTAAGQGVKLDQLLSNLTDSVSGVLKNRTNSITKTIELNTKRITQYDDILARKKARLQAQFNAMEQTLSRLQSQGTALNGLSSLASTAK